jgi:hypothetical protein
VLIGVGYASQKPQILHILPFMRPSPTPAPLASNNIVLYSPRKDEHVGQEFTITGKARVFENVVSIRLRDKLSGASYGQTQATTDATEAGQFGNFQASVSLSNPDLRSGQELLLEVYQSSARDGSEIDKVVVPIKFTPLGG